MEARMFIAGLTLLFAFGAVYASTLIVHIIFKRRSVSMAAQGDARSIGGLVSWRMRNGFAALAPLARLLDRQPQVHEFAGQAAGILSQRGKLTSTQPFLTVLIAGLILIFLLANAVTRSAVGALVCATCALCLLVIMVGNAHDKQLEQIREEVPRALESMSACFSSGFTLLQAFRQVADDTPGALGETFAQSAHILEMGGTAESALAGLREGAHASELAFVAVALDVQHQSGGAMRQVLDAATDTVKGELALRRSLRVQTAQAKLSARVVVALPFALLALFSLISPGFMDPFFSGPAGYALFGIAIAMEIAGILLVHRALSVEGMS